MSNEEKATCSHNVTQPLVGTVWVIGGWFTIGFCKLVWWKAIIAVVFWAYCPGAVLSRAWYWPSYMR